MAEQEGERGEDCSGWRLVPVELTLQVFSWLEPADLVRAELVCRRWRATIGPTSPHATFFWRTVHEVRFGGAWVRPSKEQLRWQKQREERVADAVVVASSPPAVPTGGGRRKKVVDWRASCLRCERTKTRLWRRGDVDEMVQWTVTCGHHVLLRHLLATQPVAAVAACQRVGSGNLVRWAVSSGSEPTVDLVTRHVDVPVEAIVCDEAFRLGSSPQVDLLVHRFIVATLGGHRSSSVAPAAPAADWPSAAISQAWYVEQLDEALAQTVVRGRRWSAAELFVLAGEGQHVGAMALLLARCATEAARQKLLQATNQKKNTAFLEACDRRQAKVFALLLPKLSDEQVRDTTGLDSMSALGLALRRGDVAMVRALLGRGARANGNGRESVPPLCLAVSADANRRELVDLLLQHGADVNARNRRNGKTCLHAACRLVPLDSGMIGYLLDKGADPGIVAKGWSVMGCLLAMAPPVPATNKKTEYACEVYSEERMRAAQQLLARGGSPAGGVGKPGRSLVAMVLRWVHIEGRFDKRSEEYVIRMLDLLLVHGFSIHSEPIDTLAPLVGCSAPSIIRHLAATQDLKAVLGDAGGRVAVLAPARRMWIGVRNRDNMRELFAVLGVRLDTGDPPPVHVPNLMGSSYLELLTEMVKHGADINARDSEGQTIAHCFVLESRSAPTTGTLRAWQRLGLDFSLRDGHGRTPAEAYRAWRRGLRSNPYYVYQQEEVQRVLENLQAECQAVHQP